MGGQSSADAAATANAVLGQAKVFTTARPDPESEAWDGSDRLKTLGHADAGLI